MTHMEEIEGQNMKIVKAREFKKARFEGGFTKGGGGIAKPQHRQGNNAPNPRFNKREFLMHNFFLHVLSVVENTIGNVYRV